MGADVAAFSIVKRASVDVGHEGLPIARVRLGIPRGERQVQAAVARERRALGEVRQPRVRPPIQR